MPVDLEIICPSCYRQRGEQVVIQATESVIVFPRSGIAERVYVYECNECAYHVSQPQMLFHEYRVRYTRLLDVVLNIRGWTKSQYNTLGGKLWVIERAVENYFEKGKDQ